MGIKLSILGKDLEELPTPKNVHAINVENLAEVQTPDQ